MKQVIQSLRTGAVEVAEVPVPDVRPGHLLVRTAVSLISSGTERMLVEFGKAGWIEKARQQPDKVRQVLDKARTDGLLPTLEAVLNKLDQPLALGYCNVGRVVEVGQGVTGFEVGDRVVSNGKHAEFVSVPKNLCARIPDAVDDESAAFAVIGAIALQGIRLAQPTLGETVVVTGLGLIGLLAVQLLKAHGCRVLGMDPDESKCALAERFGAEVVHLAAGRDPVAAAMAFSRGRGVDAVLITASTKSSEPVRQAATMCRKRGRIVLVGVTGLELSRAEFYEKELSFQVSCSYGPGRYDPEYEDKGHDYPIGFVRWSAQRNFEALLDMMADRRLDVAPLITHRFSIDDAQKAYEVLDGDEPSLGILLGYPSSEEARETRTIILSQPPKQVGGSNREPRVDFIGAGNYASAVLIPAFKNAGARLGLVASSGGVSGLHVARKYGFEATTTDTEALLSGNGDVVVIATRHDSHAELAVRALRAGKHVFVEKPLCLKMKDCETIGAVAGAAGAPLLMVGFNRRFSPLVQRMKRLLGEVSGPKAFVMTVNAGAIPADHWTQDPEVGGGRIVGEVCHFVDLLRFLASARITSWQVVSTVSRTRDTVSVGLTFADGSIGTIHYFANGSRAFPKERLEVFAAGGVLQMDNFRRLVGYGWPGFRRSSLWRQDKGQVACVRAFLEAVRSGRASPIPFAELLEVARVTIAIAEQVR